MTTKINHSFGFVMLVFIAISNVFVATANESKPQQDNVLTIHKTTEKGFDNYVFIVENQIDDNFLMNIETFQNRLKTMHQGVISLSLNDKNQVVFITDPNIITEEGLKHSLAVMIKFHGYSTNYQIREL